MDGNSDIIEKLWITSKLRMGAERRFRTLEYIWHIVLCIISILIISVSIFSENLNANFPSQSYNIIASVFILSITLIIFGFRFGETAAQHRECYLKIQSLINSSKQKSELQEEYNKILCAYPNHSEFDYKNFIIKSRVFYGKKLEEQMVRILKLAFLLM
jgi:hypothetical protein